MAMVVEAKKSKTKNGCNLGNCSNIYLQSPVVFGLENPKERYGVLKLSLDGRTFILHKTPGIN